MRCVQFYVLLTIILLSSNQYDALDNGLVRTPPMGWLSWERFLCNVDCDTDKDNCISDSLYRQMADRLHEDGFQDMGYTYVNIDDCWMAEHRDSDGTLQANSTRFPHGIKALADYVHSLGLKLGIYQDCGTKTCGGYPGSLGFYEKDAQTFAEWGVDMLKLDGCYADPNDMDHLYPQVTQALNKTGRDIVFSCSWPAYQVDKGIKPNYKRIAKFCNLWRNYDDIEDSWFSVSRIIDYYASVQEDLIQASGPGRWSDPDMLVIGNFGLSLEQSRSQMAIWAILAAPLLMSNDLRSLRPEHKEILTNKYVIAVNQDILGIMGRRVYKNQQIEIWTRPVSPVATDNSTSWAVVFFNRRTMGGAVRAEVLLSSLGLNFNAGYQLYDLFNDNRSVGHYFPRENFTASINVSGVVMVKAVPSEINLSPP